MKAWRREETSSEGRGAPNEKPASVRQGWTVATGVGVRERMTTGQQDGEAELRASSVADDG